MVRTIKLNDGKSIPALAWGNGTGGINDSSDRATETGSEALKAGILHIDTAQSYRTEEAAGSAIKAAGLKREDVWVTTKSVKSTPEDIKRSVKESLQKIGFIPDLFIVTTPELKAFSLIHSPFEPEEGKRVEFWQALESLVEDGTLKGCSLGVSNWRPQDLEETLKIAKIKPVVNQIEFHPYLLNHLDPVLKIQAQHGIVTESYGPLTPVLRHPTGGPLKPVLAKIAERISKDTGKDFDSAGVLLQWTIQKGVVAVTTSGKPKNIKKMADTESLGDKGRLTEDEVREIDTAGRKVHFRFYKEHMTKEFPEPDLPADI